MLVRLKRRTSDWHACFPPGESRWGCGKSIDEAIGSLIRAHGRDMFGLVIEGNSNDDEVAAKLNGEGGHD